MTIRRSPVLLMLAGLACLTGLAPAPSAVAASLEVTRDIGADGEELLFHRPMAVVFAPDSSAYILNAGDCTILHLSSDWKPLDRFGRMGEGPGEFSQPSGFILHQGKLWVFDATRIVLFGLDGTYLETIHSGHELRLPALIEGDLFARLGAGERAAARLTSRGEIDLPIGPECPTDDFFTRFRQCGLVEILPHPKYLCVLVNAFQGDVMGIADDGSVAETWKIPEGPGELKTTQNDEGMSMSLTMEFSIPMLDSRDRYWKLSHQEEDHSVILLDSGFQATGETVLVPEEIGAVRFAESPRGEIVALDGSASAVYICRLVED